MMLRLRSRAATLMADRSSHQSSPSTHKPHTNQIPSSLLTSPRLRALFVTGAHSSDQPESSPTTLISPTSILIDPFSALGSPIWYQPPPPTTNVTKPSGKTSGDSTPAAVVGLSSLILGNSDDDDVSLISKFRSNLTVRIPDCPTADFGTKTCNSPKPRKGSSEDAPPRCLSGKEMESEEEYTCVISHGPNPTTTRIFDDRIVESGLFYLSDDYKPKSTTTALKVKPPGSSESFLSACLTCGKRLNQNQDIYIYRGDKAFCSSHCRYQEILLDGAEDEEDDEKANCSHY